MSAETLLKLSIFDSKTDWIPVTFEMTEGLSECFEMKVIAYSMMEPSMAVKLLKTIGTVTLTVKSGTPRYFHGYISEIIPYEITNTSGTYRYEIGMRPWFFLTRLNQNNCIFNRMRLPDMIQQVAERCPYRFMEYYRFLGTYPERPYTVQYQESDFHFISRLLEESGISYYFKHDADKHWMTFLEPPCSLPSYPGGALQYGNTEPYKPRISAWSRIDSDEVTDFEVRGYNFETPSYPVVGYAGQPSKNPLNRTYSVYSDDIQTTTQAENMAKLLKERALVRAKTIKGQGTCSALTPGMTFELANHPNPKENGRYLVTKTRHRAVDAYYWEKLQEHIHSNLTITEDVYDNEFFGIPADTSFRPQAQHKKPHIHGYHLAKVWAPEGERLWPDQYGRVMVTFSWDSTQTRTMPIRVAQPWAGNGMGVQFLPRAGDEVIVKYLSGDIDHPVIVGSACNGNNATVFPLPDKMTTSGFRTHSLYRATPQESNGLQFVDSQGNEAINIYAQRNFNLDVNNNFNLQIGNNQTFNVSGDFISTAIEGDMTYDASSITLRVDSSEIITGDTGIFFNAPNVTILTDGGDPVEGAARVGDQSQCPEKNSDGTPHSEGTIHAGASNVFINNCLVARYGDPLGCEDGSTDTITQGVTGLYVNGKPAATLNHYTAHNGVIHTSSENVFLGGLSNQTTDVPVNSVSQTWMRENLGSYAKKKASYECFSEIENLADGYMQALEPVNTSNNDARNENYQCY